MDNADIEKSAWNADEGGINDDVPTKHSQYETGTQDSVNHKPEENCAVYKVQETNEICTQQKWTC